MSPQVGQLTVHVRGSRVSAHGVVVPQHREHELAAERVTQQMRQVLHGCQLLLRRQTRRMRQTVSATQHNISISN